MSSPRVDGRTLRYQHRRPELLEAVTEYVLDHGLGELTLRQIARALGVTHATLLRHFSSKDELLMCVVHKVHDDLMAKLRGDPELSAPVSTAGLLAKMWPWLCEPGQQRQFVLLFELVGGVARGEARAGWLDRSVVDDWLAPIEQRLLRDGWPPREAPVLATTVLAQIRGLQLDLLVTGDRARVDGAFQLALRLLERG